MEVSIQKLDGRKALFIDGRIIKGLNDYKIISSADGTTELIISMKLKTDTFKCDLKASPKERIGGESK